MMMSVVICARSSTTIIMITPITLQTSVNPAHCRIHLSLTNVANIARLHVQRRTSQREFKSRSDSLRTVAVANRVATMVTSIAPVDN